RCAQRASSCPSRRTWCSTSRASLRTMNHRIHSWSEGQQRALSSHSRTREPVLRFAALPYRGRTAASRQVIADECKRLFSLLLHHVLAGNILPYGWIVFILV